MSFTSELIYDWNTTGESDLSPTRSLSFLDVTLRDGLQSPSVCEPTFAERLELLRLMDKLGVAVADIGFPGAGETHARRTEKVVRAIANEKMTVQPNCAARTHASDIAAVARIAARTGAEVSVALFIGSSPVRCHVEDWTLDLLLKRTEEAVTFAVRENLPVMFVTEDTTRTRPETIRALYTTAIRCGARAVCVCDTTGHATPDGTRAVVRFVREVIDECDSSIRLDWHGHQDRGLGIINSIVAAEAGANQLHGAALGIGERAGNTPLDGLLVNLKLMNRIHNDLAALDEYCSTAARVCGWTIPENYPVFGRDAFRTASGIHAAAIIKANRKGGAELADLIYSGVPARAFGKTQIIEINSMSGKSNVVHWLESRNLEASTERVRRIYEFAKSSRKVLEEAEVMRLVREG